ncbi:MAG: AbrB/MazE/SpoVT family DNA-binding domain-containing protein [Rhodocyclales bacterium]|nr:AbrB/MazE/SpoVT family DNA-binding domain-containing protein [Rhodocyclales bacterium]
MNLIIARWGNSLALRIPADYAWRAGLKEGDKVEARLTADGGIAIRPARWNRKLFAQELAKTRDAMPMGISVMDEVRRGACR